MNRKKYIEPIIEIEVIKTEELLVISESDSQSISAGSSDDEVDASEALGRSTDYWDDEY